MSAVAYVFLTAICTALLTKLYALSALAHWGALLVWACLMLCNQVYGWQRPVAHFKVLLCGWLLATVQTHHSDVQLVQQAVGFGAQWMWTLLFWLVLLPLLLSSWTLVDYLAQVWRRQPVPKTLEHEPSIVLLQVALWLALIIVVAQWSLALALSSLQFLLLAALGFAIGLQVTGSEQARWPLTRLGACMALMAGSLAQLIPLKQLGVVGAMVWIVLVLGLIFSVFYLGWLLRGKPEDQPKADATSAEDPIINPLPPSAEMLAEEENSAAESARRRQLSLEERVAADLADEEARLLAQAEEIRQQTPEQRAEKLRAAIAQAQAQEAADKWTRE
ncbi:hypothetical protein HZU75_15105 [Chitinibacter fontanus]|uniref:Uncharacterized protein n=1 Tax=Chitinibacter fontanus TaxID=1737446 RepID=A0A7D5VC58_9NEIS|nr:hypothetical protein [Chitinibacter fontanus]QLI82740.1 hypothetical protein HZU75_15105 [Chitinibacter fontanus]